MVSPYQQAPQRKALTPIITNSILLTTKKRRIVVNDTDETFTNKTTENIVKKS